jgi:hypothetical protein
MTIEETERQQYRGVRCLHCKAPIPVPAVVGLTRLAPAEGAAASVGNSQVFNVRCPACHKEKPYWTMEIVNFVGSPEIAAFSARPASVRSFRPGEIGKAAKA